MSKFESLKCNSFDFIQNIKFMSNILFGHGYATKYVIMNGIKKLRKHIYTNNSLPYYYGVLVDKISFSVLLWFPVTKK
jgi:hypothetical protein